MKLGIRRFLGSLIIWFRIFQMQNGEINIAGIRTNYKPKTLKIEQICLKLAKRGFLDH